MYNVQTKSRARYLPKKYLNNECTTYALSPDKNFVQYKEFSKGQSFSVGLNTYISSLRL